MIEFKKKVEECIPYDRKQYKLFKKWYGVSFQLPGVFEGKDIGLEAYLKAYEEWFRNIIFKFDDNCKWVINHDFIDEAWFPNNQNNLQLLRGLFKQNNIPNTFTGAIIFSNDNLLEYLKDIMSYPYAVIDKKGVLYNNLDISHNKLQFVIKITGHLSIDLLSTDIELLRRLVSENFFADFKIIEYRGTSLNNNTVRV